MLHERHRVPHVVITSVSFTHPGHPITSLSVVGSTMTSAREARPFKIVFPAINAYFSGTGDMFAALMVVRIRQAVQAVPGLATTEAWVSADDVAPLDLPLARAAERVLASMHEVLTKTCQAMEVDMIKARERGEAGEKRLRLLQSRAAELRLVRHLDLLRAPQVEFGATEV